MEQLHVQGHVVNIEHITHWFNRRKPLISLNLYLHFKENQGSASLRVVKN